MVGPTPRSRISQSATIANLSHQRSTVLSLDHVQDESLSRPGLMRFFSFTTILKNRHNPFKHLQPITFSAARPQCKTQNRKGVLYPLLAIEEGAVEEHGNASSDRGQSPQRAKQHGPA